MDTARYSLDELNARLHPRLAELCGRLFARYEIQGNQLWFHNPARKDPNLKSASVNLHTGVWKDFALGDEFAGKGGLSLIAAFACGGDFKRAIVWAKDFLGLSGRAPDPADTRRVAERSAKADREAAEKAARKRRAAFALWIQAAPLDGHDPASCYLAERGIDIHALPEIPRSLRYHGRVRAMPEAVELPCMLACMSREGLQHGFAAVHRTYLEEREGRWRKAWDGRRAKRILGGFAGASVRLTRGASGKALREAPDGEWVQLAEGIENALTAAIARPNLRTLAAGSLTNLGNVVFPERIGGVFVIADNDDDPKTRAQFEREMDRLSERHALQIVRPIGAKDLNAAVTG